MEIMGIDKKFWRGKSVFITGHTGFKGGWMSLWLQSMGAVATGYSLDPPTEPNLFTVARVGDKMTSIHGDVLDNSALTESMVEASPEIVFHFAAQPLVLSSYSNPIHTIAVNVLGTANLLEAVRHCDSVNAVVVVTSDKCYENKEWLWSYRENEALGGSDPYSASKACAELVTTAWRKSFFAERAKVASVRSGNVIGGGDWAPHRLVPDALKAWEQGAVLNVRSPFAIRPWQHVLEPLAGYLLLAQRLVEGSGDEAWNFGPDETDMKTVEQLLNKLAACWGSRAVWETSLRAEAHEARHLKLDSSKSRAFLRWRPTWNLDEALARTVDWHLAYLQGKDMQEYTLKQIREHHGLVGNEEAGVTVHG